MTATPAAAAELAPKATTSASAITGMWAWGNPIDPAVDARGDGDPEFAPKALAAFASAHKLKTVYLSVPWAADEGPFSSWLKASITALHKAGVKTVAALGGDPAWADQPDLAATWTRSALSIAPRASRGASNASRARSSPRRTGSGRGSSGASGRSPSVATPRMATGGTSRGRRRRRRYRQRNASATATPRTMSATTSHDRSRWRGCAASCGSGVPVVTAALCGGGVSSASGSWIRGGLNVGEPCVAIATAATASSAPAAAGTTHRCHAVLELTLPP